MDAPGPAVTGPAASSRRRRLAALALAAAASAIAGAARAEPLGACAPSFEASGNPLAGGTTTFTPADFGTIPEVCPGSEVWLRLRGELLDAADAPDFFGQLIGSATLRARHRVTAWSWLSLSVDLLEYQFVDNGGLVGTAARFGPATIGYHWTALDRPRGAVALYARALLPIDNPRDSGVQAGLELGASARAPLRHRLAVDGGLALFAPLDVTGGQVHGWLRTSLLGEAWWSSSPRFALLAGLGAMLQLAPAPDLVALAPRVGVRGGFGRHHLWLGFLAEAPMAGFDRTNVMASAFLGWAP